MEIQIRIGNYENTNKHKDLSQAPPTCHLGIKIHLKTQITRNPNNCKEPQLNTILNRVKARKGFAQLSIRLSSTKCDGCDFFLAPCHPIAKHIDLQHGGIMLGWFYIDLLVFEANPTQIVPRHKILTA